MTLGRSLLSFNHRFLSVFLYLSPQNPGGQREKEQRPGDIEQRSLTRGCQWNKTGGPDRASNLVDRDSQREPEPKRAEEWVSHRGMGSRGISQRQELGEQRGSNRLGEWRHTSVAETARSGETSSVQISCPAAAHVTQWVTGSVCSLVFSSVNDKNICQIFPFFFFLRIS